MLGISPVTSAKNQRARPSPVRPFDPLHTSDGQPAEGPTAGENRSPDAEVTELFVLVSPGTSAGGGVPSSVETER